MNILKQAWQQGIEPFLYFGSLSAHRIDRAPLTEADRIFLKMNKTDLINEISTHAAAPRISGSELYGPGLMEDAAERARKGRVK